MRISGHLDGDGVRTVLRLLAQGGSSGVLRLRAPRTRGRLILIDGRVMQASLDTVAPLGETLVAKGVLEKEQVDGALSVQKRGRKNRPLGQVLLDLRMAEPGDIGHVLEEQIRDVVGELLSWREGSYAFEPLPAPIDDAAFAGVEVESLVGAPGAAH
jgi:hypothetical protein